MQIGKVKLKNNLFLAPMAGISDVGFRTVCNKLGAGLTYTEMVSAAALFYKNKKTEELLKKSSKIEAVQLFGKNPEHFAYAIKHPLVQQFDIIDINMGCPAKKIVKNGEGSALMKNPDLAEQIIKACVQNTDKPVTVKFRADNAVAFAKMCENAGASAIAVHGRTAAQMYSGKADRDVIKQVVNAVKIPVIANGDVKNKQDYLNILSETGAAAVMIGRGSFGKPWVFAEILDKKINFDKNEIIKTHEKLLNNPNEMKKHLLWYKKNL